MIQSLIALVLALAIAASVQTVRLHGLQSDIAIQKSAQVEADRVTERRMSLRNAEIDHDTQARLVAARADADATRADADGLRDALSDVLQRPAATASCVDERERADRLAKLLAEAAGLVEEGQERGAAIAVQVIGLQQFVGDVCVARD